MAEPVDAIDSKSVVREGVPVRVRLGAPFQTSDDAVFRGQESQSGSRVAVRNGSMNPRISTIRLAFGPDYRSLVIKDVEGLMPTQLPAPGRNITIRGRVMNRFFGIWVCATVLAAASMTTAEAAETSIRIGTGGKTGVYFPTGGAICRLVNRGKAEHGISCTVESTGGSVYNLKAIRASALDFGIAQSDWQFHSYKGSSKFEEDKPFEELRSVFSVHPEPFTVVARANSGIKSFDDLKGKRVNIGNPGSGQRGTMDVLMAAKGWTTKDFELVTELKSTNQARAVCDNKIDAMVFTVGHPSGAIKEATTLCDTVLVEVSGPVIDELIANNPYYRSATIPGKMYKGNDTDTRTFGVGATLVTSSKVSEDVVYNLVKSVFGKFKRFKRLHPALGILKQEEMIKDGLSAPLHDGAAKYYKEMGWM